MTGYELKTHRRACGLTQTDVATKLGIKYQAIQKWERTRGEEAIIPTQYWNVLAEMFSIPVDTFIPRASEDGGKMMATASGGSVAISAGGDVTNSIEGMNTGGQGNGDIGRLTAREHQAIILKRRYDPSEVLLTKFVERLLSIKKVYQSM